MFRWEIRLRSGVVVFLEEDSSDHLACIDGRNEGEGAECSTEHVNVGREDKRQQEHSIPKQVSFECSVLLSPPTTGRGLIPSRPRDPASLSPFEASTGVLARRTPASGIFLVEEEVIFLRISCFRTSGESKDEGTQLERTR